MRRRLFVGHGPLPGLEATLIYGGGVTGTAAYWVTDRGRVARRARVL